jgi:2-phosphosulfolactate phosphatase
MTGPRLEVCYSPALLHTHQRQPGRNVVVVDILRATTAICTAFGYGVASVEPVVEVKTALARKAAGMLVAGEEQGEKLSFADFGNSPMEFRTEAIRGKRLVFRTTNGTRAMLKARPFGQVIIASFVNLDAVSAFLNRDRKDVLILCSGWNDNYSLEDTLFAGAMSDLLVNAYGFLPDGDAVLASMMLWRHSAKDLLKTISRSSHYLRLLGIEDRKGLKYCVFPEKFHVVPALKGRTVRL